MILSHCRRRSPSRRDNPACRGVSINVKTGRVSPVSSRRCALVTAARSLDQASPFPYKTQFRIGAIFSATRTEYRIPAIVSASLRRASDATAGRFSSAVTSCVIAPPSVRLISPPSLSRQRRKPAHRVSHDITHSVINHPGQRGEFQRETNSKLPAPTRLNARICIDG